MLAVASLHVKPAPGAPMRAVPDVTGIAGRGLVGDASADASSPRHVLLVAASDVQTLALAAHDLRANLVVTGDLRALASGQLVAFGTLVLRITIPCEPCHHLNRVRAGLAKQIGDRRGVLARVLSSGRAEVGATATVLPRRAPALHADWRERVHDLLAHLPADHVITPGALVRAAGVQPVYGRALPTVLRALAARGAPVHRVVRASALEPSTLVWDAASYFARDELLQPAHVFPSDRLPGLRRRCAP